MAARRTKIDSVQGAIRLTHNAQRGAPQPTEHLSERETKHFAALINSKSQTDLAEWDVMFMTQLAQITELMCLATQRVKAEGFTIIDDRGNPRTNPVVNSLDQMSRHAANLSRALGLAASQRGSGSSAAAKKRDKADIAARDVIAAAAEHDNLI